MSKFGYMVEKHILHAHDRATFFFEKLQRKILFNSKYRRTSYS